jgi:O-succinylbenzoic acid--CoA ligase
MLVSGGVNVHPAEAERVLVDAPGVVEVAVTGRRDAVWGDVLVAAYRGRAESAALEAWCRDHLPRHLRPRAFLRVGSLPFSPEGKLDRRALRRIAETTV